ncbi:MAG: NADPH-dependent FMN reductase [Salinispira sp.]
MSERIMVLLGTVREERMGKAFADWLMTELKKMNSSCSFELVDLKEIDLPLMNEPVPPLLGKPYAFEHSRKWSELVKSFDGYIFLTAEYNHGYTAILKNALDYLYTEWVGKPAAFVGYGGSGAERAIRQLWQVIDVLGMRRVHATVSISNAWEAFREDGTINEKCVKGSISDLVKDIEARLKSGV